MSFLGGQWRGSLRLHRRKAGLTAVLNFPWRVESQGWIEPAETEKGEGLEKERLVGFYLAIGSQ